MPPSPEARPATSASLRDCLFVPLLSTQTIGHLSGQWWTLLLGVFSGLWSGSFVVTSTQAAFNSVWELPYAQRPSFGGQLNMVLKERLYPRGLVDSPATKAGYRAYKAYANERTYHPDEGVRTKSPRHGAEG